jgi:hypothetical protein
MGLIRAFAGNTFLASHRHEWSTMACIFVVQPPSLLISALHTGGRGVDNGSAGKIRQSTLQSRHLEYNTAAWPHLLLSTRRSRW